MYICIYVTTCYSTSHVMSNFIIIVNQNSMYYVIRNNKVLSYLILSYLYLNDLQEFLSMAYDRLGNASEYIKESAQDNDVIVYLKLFTILCADDTVIFAENRTSCHECYV